MFARLTFQDASGKLFFVEEQGADRVVTMTKFYDRIAKFAKPENKFVKLETDDHAVISQFQQKYPNAEHVLVGANSKPQMGKAARPRVSLGGKGNFKEVCDRSSRDHSSTHRSFRIRGVWNWTNDYKLCHCYALDDSNDSRFDGYDYSVLHFEQLNYD